MLKNPDVISFMDYPFRAICEDGLKIPAEIANNKEIAVWYAFYIVNFYADYFLR